MGLLNKHCYFEGKAGEMTIGWALDFLFGLNVAVVVCSLACFFFFFFKMGIFFFFKDLDTASGLYLPAPVPH